MLFVYNRYDERMPFKITQLIYPSYEECIDAEFGEEAVASDSVEIVHGECNGAYYYEIASIPQELTVAPSLSPTVVVVEHNDTDIIDDYYEKIYKSIFGPQGPTSIEVDIILLSVILIFGCCCCSILLWCGWLKGCTDLCWNVVCCGRYTKLAEAARHDEMDDIDTGDDSVEMGHIAHVLMPPDDNMELAALSEHSEDKDKRRRKVRKPKRRHRL